MAQVTITQLPSAEPLTGTESVPISQNGKTVQTTVADIANSPTQQQTFITVNPESTLPNGRQLSGSTGVGLTDTGSQGTISVILNGVSGSLETSTNGIISKSGSSVVGRTITGSGTGVAVTNGDGVSGNPVVALDGPVSTINGLAGNGILALTASTSVGAIEIVGTGNQITVANGTGQGNPTISIANNPVIPGVAGMTVPIGATGDRSGGAVNGTMRYNSTNSRFEGYQNNSWANFGSGDGSVTSVDVSGGATGLTTSGGPITGSGTITLVGTPVSATNIAGGATNKIPYQVTPSNTSFVDAPVSADTFLKWSGSAFTWGTIAGAGTVTSVDGSGGTTGLTLTGGPITSSGTLTLGGTLGVANGGSGAATLTGYLIGNGASAFTASATIPNTAITGLGTMSTQAASSVAITGGTINGTTVGATSAAAGTFTSVAMTSGTITATPSSGNDIVNKTYADTIAAGINFHQSCNYASTTALPASTYNNGTSGVGATLTANANGALIIDGYTFTSPTDDGKRILIKNQANTAHNGVYVLSQAGDAVPGTPFILTRSTDFNTPGTGVNQINAGDFFLITSGTANANTSWVQQTPLPIIMGTTGIVFAQFGAPIVYSPGTGLTESPAYTFNIATTGVVAASYGGAATAVSLSINAQGQVTSASDVSIAIAGSQITSGTVGSAYISGSYTGITGVGTLAAGTWNATTIAPAYGGTGLTSYSVGDLIYASGTATISKLALGTSTHVLVAGAAAPEYVAQSTLSVGSASTATTATNATNVAVTADSANATRYLAFYSATTGNLGTLVDADITFNPSTNTLTTATVVATSGISGGTF
jgi:hypothetical protein